MTLADLFAADADAGVLRVLEEAERALTAAEVKKALQAAGVAKDDVDKAWPSVQKRLKAHDQVKVEGTRYKWMSPLPLSALEALDLLVNGGLAAPRRLALAEAIRAALVGPNHDGAAKGGPAKGGPAKDDPESVARQRQAEIDAVRLLAELASEVEELIVNETEPAVLIRQVRAWVKRSGLEPVDRAGEQIRFDRKRHRPIGGPIRDGSMVIVVRPGYVWKTSEKDVLIGKAVVEE